MNSGVVNTAEGAWGCDSTRVAEAGASPTWSSECCDPRNRFCREGLSSAPTLNRNAETSVRDSRTHSWTRRSCAREADSRALLKRPCARLRVCRCADRCALVTFSFPNYPCFLGSESFPFNTNRNSMRLIGKGSRAVPKASRSHKLQNPHPRTRPLRPGWRSLQLRVVPEARDVNGASLCTCEGSVDAASACAALLAPRTLTIPQP